MSKFKRLIRRVGVRQLFHQESDMNTTVGVLGVLAVGVAGFLGYVASKPDTFRIERSIAIHAAPGAVFAKVNDLHEFNRWNPFALADQTTKIDYHGPASGVGSSYNWQGDKSGNGTMTILESNPALVVMRLEFRKPYIADNRAVFSFEPSGSETRVTWAMTGRYVFLHKLLGTFFSMDKMVGGEFDKGLATLKTQIEG
jgi:carbon monoxide dehydrogenase subunit G